MSKMIFLDNGATSFPKPEEVYSYMDYFFRNYGVNPGRSGYDLCMETGLVVEETRKMLTGFFNGTDPNRLCFGYNSTDALNLIIFGLLKPGDHAITTTLEHNSVLRPLYHLSLQGVEVDYAPFDGDGFGAIVNASRSLNFPWGKGAAPDDWRARIRSAMTAMRDDLERARASS